MSRKSTSLKRRDITPDSRYKDKLVAKLINKLMLEGKKSVSERVVYSAFGYVNEKAKDDPLKIFKEALENIKPVMEVRSRRVGGATYQVPMEVRPERRVALGLRWLLASARSRGERSMEEKLCAEILEARVGKGNAVKKKDEVHRMAEANRAFSHYRW
ncbi:MAG: 30S ribosomal protein S7 [Deltaproteobacteria bacterium]|nr:30S ribosomal protein S7 [Deltaproteobacteria bacterium]